MKVIYLQLPNIVSMNQSFPYIAELLRREQCVIVPDLGAFVAKRVGATIDTKRAVMLPPRMEVVFNSRIRHDDGMLTNFIARSEGISYKAAADEVGEFVRYAKRQINLGQPLMIGGVGTMRRTADGEAAFTVDRQNDLLTESYGLPSLPLRRATTAEHASIAVPSRVGRVAASVAILVGLLLVAPETRIDNAASYTKADISEMLVAPKTAPEVAAEKPMTDGPRYCLIVASFKTAVEADEYIAEQGRSGVSGLEKIRQRGNGRVRVSAASFDTRDEAVQRNRQLRRVAGFEKSWILRCDAR